MSAPSTVTIRYLKHMGKRHGKHRHLEEHGQLDMITLPPMVLHYQQLRAGLSDSETRQNKNNLQPALHMLEPLSIT